MTDISISGLALGCPLLSRVDLSFCSQITDIGISVLGEGCHLLTAISLSCCENITDIELSLLFDAALYEAISTFSIVRISLI